jgi:hypothetical protein
MPVPNSITIIDDSEWKTAPQVRFKTKKSFDHSGNILTMIRGGGCLRGLLGQGGAGSFEVLSKRELREEDGDVKIGHGRKVSSYVIQMMIVRKEIFVVPNDEAPSGIVYAVATVDDFYTEGFPSAWGVQDKPYLGVSMLYKKAENGLFEVCVRPRGLSIEQWVPVARAMAVGAQGVDLESVAA